VESEGIAQGALKSELEAIRSALEQLSDEHLWMLERGYHWERINTEGILRVIAEIVAARGLRADAELTTEEINRWLESDDIAQRELLAGLQHAREALERVPDDRILSTERGYKWEQIRIDAILRGIAEIRARRGLRAPHLDESQDPPASDRANDPID